jgi:integrase
VKAREQVHGALQQAAVADLAHLLENHAKHRKSVRHGCLRAVLNQGKAWELVRTNPAQGVRLPRKKARKPPVVLAKQDIRRVIEALPEPTKSIVALVVVGSLRIGEIAALRWERIQADRIEIVERFYEGEFDDTKTDAGRGSIPLDSHGILRAVLDTAWQRSKYRKPQDLVFTNAKGGPVNRRNLLRRHLKPTVKKLGLPETVDFRSFRTMHSSLMSSIGVRPEGPRFPPPEQRESFPMPPDQVSGLTTTRAFLQSNSRDHSTKVKRATSVSGLGFTLCS